MPGTSAGTGQPVWFRCTVQRNGVDLGMPFDVTKELEARLQAPTGNEKE